MLTDKDMLFLRRTTSRRYRIIAITFVSFLIAFHLLIGVFNLYESDCFAKKINMSLSTILKDDMSKFQDSDTYSRQYVLAYDRYTTGSVQLLAAFCITIFMVLMIKLMKLHKRIADNEEVRKPAEQNTLNAAR